MPDTRDVITLSAPVPAHQTQTQKTQPGKGRVSDDRANQAGPYYRQADNVNKAGKKPFAAKDGGQDDVLTSFMALLNQFSAQTAQPEKTGALPAAPELQVSDQQPGKPEDEANGLIPAGNDKPIFSKPVPDLAALLKAGLKERGVGADALPEEISEALTEMGIDTPLDLKNLEAALAGLRQSNLTQKQEALPEESDSASEVKPLPPGQPKADIEALPAADMAEAAPDKEVQEEPEAEQPGNAQAVLTPPREDREVKTGGKAEELQPLTISKFSAYLKPEAPKETAARDAKPAEDNTGGKADKTAAAEVGAVRVSEDSKPRDGLSGGMSGRQEERPQEEQGARPVPSKASHEPAGKGTELDEPKAKTNFTENRPAFEQFFNAARRDAAPAPQLDLGRELNRGLQQPLSRGEALSEGLSGVVRFIRTGGEQRANMIVDPPAIGRISVELTSTATGLEASIKVTSEQVRQLIQDNLTQLKLSLEQQGVQLTHFSVDVQQDDRRQQGHKNSQNPHNSQKARRASGVGGVDGEEDVLGEEALFRVDLNQGLLYWVA